MVKFLETTPPVRFGTVSDKDLLSGRHILLLVVTCVLLWAGCATPGNERIRADRAAYRIIEGKQEEALGKSRPFTIERPSDLLRKRLLLGQDLNHDGAFSFGRDQLTPPPHWPDLGEEVSLPVTPHTGPLRLSLVEALQVAAANSFEYQDFKEDVFRAALSLDLAREEFRTSFTGRLTALFSTDKNGGARETGNVYSGEADAARKLKNGLSATTLLAVDLATLLSSGGASALGILSDTSISIPLLRGAGKHIVTEPLTQAERDVVYSIYALERFKKSFAVSVAEEYLSVLRELDRVDNTRGNYMRLIRSVTRARRLADAGRLPEIQVDQAVQDELRARDSWVSAVQDHALRLDEFKVLVGLPTDGKVDLAREELDHIVKKASRMLPDHGKGVFTSTSSSDPAEGQGQPLAGPPTVSLEPPGWNQPGPFEISPDEAVGTALKNRLDLKVARGEVLDRMRGVVVAADALGAELTILGRALIGERRSVSDAGDTDSDFNIREGYYSALFTLDFPFERTFERTEFRRSILDLEESIRGHNTLEDLIKLAVRSHLRELLKARESYQIQAKGVEVAKKRINSTTLFLKAGRAAIRDLLEAEDALLSVQNALTAAVVDYRVAEMALLRDMGTLVVDEKGLMPAFSE